MTYTTKKRIRTTPKTRSFVGVRVRVATREGGCNISTTQVSASQALQFVHFNNLFAIRMVKGTLKDLATRYPGNTGTCTI
jgi:hypothetical protein